MKILVTGGCGFIGSHLVRQLLENGDEVLAIDNMSVGNEKNLPKHPNLKVQVADILDNTLSYFKGIDIVYHLAALTRPQESIIDPITYNMVNVQGTIKILNHCVKQKVKRIVFASTTGLYGDQKEQPIPEGATPRPMSPYALTKLIGEQYLQLFKELHGLEYNIIRPFNVYGPRQSTKGEYAAAVPTFINILKDGGTPYITGDGEQSRDFIYVGDVADLMILMANSTISGEAFNAGSGTTTTINDIYLNIRLLMSKKVKPNYIDPVFEPAMTWGDIFRAERLLGWVPTTKLDKGLELTVKSMV